MAELVPLLEKTAQDRLKIAMPYPALTGWWELVPLLEKTSPPPETVWAKLRKTACSKS